MLRLVLAMILCGLQSPRAAERVPWTASKVAGSSDAPAPLVAERVFSNLVFDHGLELLGGVGLGRLFVVERGGKIWSFLEDGSSETPDLFIDLKQLHPKVPNTYGLAFHPKFRENKEVYLFYTVEPMSPDGSRISRFKLASLEPPRIDPGSEELLLEFHCGGHNGGHLLFGPEDGYLYISAGDMRPPWPPDVLDTGQDLSDLAGGIIRIDVNGRDGKRGLAYRIPEDNPFVGMSGVREENWSYGMRNPWKMCFHPQTHDLLVGDVGWELYELLHIARSGSNHGWPIMEGPQPIRSDVERGPTPIVPSLKVYDHTEGASITGGYVSATKRLPQIAGGYVYGDFVNGKVWALWLDGESRIARHEEIARTSLAIVSFGMGDTGEVYLLDWGKEAGIYRFAPNPAEDRSGEFPRKLSATGLFEDVATERATPGVYPFEIRARAWADGAEARYWCGFPGTSGATTQWRGRNQNRRQRVVWTKDQAGMVLAKTLALGARKVETQLLHFDGAQWHGYSYRWNAAQTDANLVRREGEDALIEIGSQRVRWRFFGRTECFRCHTKMSEFALAFRHGQLNRSVQRGGVEVNQIDWMRGLGLLDAKASPERSVENLVDPYDTGAPLEGQARSWLHANCAHCHRKGGGGSVTLQLNVDASLDEAGIFDVPPARGDFGIEGAKVAVPGDPYRSTLFYRIATTGPGHMPMIGSKMPDRRGMIAVHDWIARKGERGAKPGRGTVSSALAYLHHTNLGMESPYPLDELRAAKNPAIDGLVGVGNSARVEDALALRGDAAKGKTIYDAVCATCHQVGGKGIPCGPDLTFIGQKLGKRELLESMLNPGAVLDSAFQGVTLRKEGGFAMAGIVISESDTEIHLSAPGVGAVPFKKSEVTDRVPVAGSLMPAGLLDGRSPEEVADLLAYLASLR